MRRLAKAATLLIAAILLIPLLAFFTYDALVFWPHRDEIESILAKADPLDRTPPPSIERYIRTLHRGRRPAASVEAVVARHLHWRFLPEKRSMLNWHMRGLLWERLVSIHLSQDEILGLYCTLSFNGDGQGMNALSGRLFSKPLGALSDREAATVVAFISSPGFIGRNPERLAAQRDKLIAKGKSWP